MRRYVMHTAEYKADTVKFAMRGDCRAAGWMVAHSQRGSPQPSASRTNHDAQPCITNP
jgi:hypothetical protein